MRLSLHFATRLSWNVERDGQTQTTGVRATSHVPQSGMGRQSPSFPASIATTSGGSQRGTNHTRGQLLLLPALRTALHLVQLTNLRMRRSVRGLLAPQAKSDQRFQVWSSTKAGDHGPRVRLKKIRLHQPGASNAGQHRVWKSAATRVVGGNLQLLGAVRAG